MALTSQQSREALRALLDARLGEGPGADWVASHAGTTDLDAVRELIPQAARAVGRKHLIGAFAERATAKIDAVWGPLGVGDWRTGESAAVLLLAEAADGSDDPYAALFRTYDLGDTDTRVAALRALNFVQKGDPAQGLELVLDAGRTYLPQLMGAGWCNNPFSSVNLSDHDFRKAVLKAFFCNVPVEGFLLLQERADAELAQSLCEYIDERLAAGRQVPQAIWAIAALHPQPGLVARLIGNLEHPDADERFAAACALANAADVRALPFVIERQAREQTPEVADALGRAREAIEGTPESDDDDDEE